MPGEEEQLLAMAALLRTAADELAKAYRGPTMPVARECLQWLAREAFRRGYLHAHRRATLPAPEDK